MPTLRRSTLLPVLVVALAACTGGGAASTPPSAAPSVAPSPSAPDFGAIDHKTGATDILLRYEEGGGFMMPAFIATMAPHYTLYGDGTVIFRDPADEPPPPIGSVFLQNPFKTAKLTEDQIQETLAFALGEGGLGVARENYENQMIADASTATFTVEAGGIKKVVNVYALGMQDGPDMPARAAFQRLAERLTNFDNDGAFATDTYEPAQYRGILMDGQPAPDAKPWPWTDITPADFPMPADPNAFQMATRTLSAADVAALGLEGVEGGFQGMVLQDPEIDGKLYNLSVRPLLPDETS